MQPAGGGYPLASQGHHMPAVQTQQVAGSAPLGYTYVMPEVVPLTPPPEDLQIIRIWVLIADIHLPKRKTPPKALGETLKFKI